MCYITFRICSLGKIRTAINNVIKSHRIFVEKGYSTSAFVRARTKTKARDEQIFATAVSSSARKRHDVRRRPDGPVRWRVEGKGYGDVAITTAMTMATTMTTTKLAHDDDKRRMRASCRRHCLRNTVAATGQTIISTRWTRGTTDGRKTFKPSSTRDIVGYRNPFRKAKLSADG